MKYKCEEKTQKHVNYKIQFKGQPIVQSRLSSIYNIMPFNLVNIHSGECTMTSTIKLIYIQYLQS